MSAIEPRPPIVTRRLRTLAALADLRPERRLDSKVDCSAEAITRRLRQVGALRRFCLALRLPRRHG